MPTMTTYTPTRVGDFEAGKLNFNAQGVAGLASLNTITNFDLDLTDDHLITGFWMIGNDITIGDRVDLQVVDKNNLFGAGANAVIKQFATDVYLPGGSISEQFEVAYPAKVYGGLTIRIVYHSTLVSGTQAYFGVNLKLHKVLV